MPKRNPQMQNFLDCFEASILLSEASPREAVSAAGRIFGALTARTCGQRTAPPSRLPVCAYLDPALADARSGPERAVDLAAALKALAPSLEWTRRAGWQAHGPTFANGHANTLIVGPHGLEQRDDVRVGVSLLAPNVAYPDHRHPPEEVYVVLSLGDWRHGNQAWFTPGVSGIVYNLPCIPHAMRSGARPLLAAWCQWAPELTRGFSGGGWRLLAGPNRQRITPHRADWAGCS